VTITTGLLRKRASVDDLMLSGVRAITEKGIDHVSVLDVVTLSGVSRPTFYTYFGDIHGFYAEIWLRYGKEWLCAQLDETKPIDPAVDQALLEIFTAARRIPEVFEVLQPEISEWWEKSFGGDKVAELNGSWLLAYRIGLKISIGISHDVAKSKPLVDVFKVPTNVFETPVVANLAPMPERFTSLPGFGDVGNNVDAVLQQAAIEVIASAGVAAASITRIARRARVSTGSIYPRYKNLDLLVQASFKRTIEEIVDGNVGRFEAADYDLDAYGNSVNAGYGQSRTIWRNYRAEMHLEAAHNKVFAEAMAPGFYSAMSSLRSLANRWGLSGEPAEQLGWFLHAHAIGATLLFNALPAIERIDNRVMTRWAGYTLQKKYQLG